MNLRHAMDWTRNSGFTLVEIAIVLLIVGLLSFYMVSTTATLVGNTNRATTRARLVGVDTALALYVAQNKRLPCPADGTIAAGNANAGVEVTVAPYTCSNQQSGVLPWVTLGITEADALDGWNRRLTYRVAPVLVKPNAMDMSACDPAGSGSVVAGGLCNSTCTSSTLSTCTTPANFLQDKGLNVKDAAGNALMSAGSTPATGTAYVLISHGENGSGAYSPEGTLVVTSGGKPEGTAETQNRNATPVRLPPGDAYVDASQNDSDSLNHFDDIVSRPTILSVINRAQLGPRAHL